MDDAGLELREGIEAKQAILTQLAGALEVIRQHDPARIVTLGGECAADLAEPGEVGLEATGHGHTPVPTS